MSEKFALTLLGESYAVCRLEPHEPPPAWAQSDAAFCSITRTPTEISIVCPEHLVPADVAVYRGWRVLAVQGPLNPNLIGVLARLTGTLAAAGVSVFALSTYDTDYLLVPEREAQQAVRALRRADYTVTVDPGDPLEF